MDVKVTVFVWFYAERKVFSNMSFLTLLLEIVYTVTDREHLHEI